MAGAHHLGERGDTLLRRRRLLGSEPSPAGGRAARRRRGCPGAQHPAGDLADCRRCRPWRWHMTNASCSPTGDAATLSYEQTQRARGPRSRLVFWRRRLDTLTTSEIGHMRTVVISPTTPQSRQSGPVGMNLAPPEDHRIRPKQVRRQSSACAPLLHALVIVARNRGRSRSVSTARYPQGFTGAGPAPRIGGRGCTADCGRARPVGGRSALSRLRGLGLGCVVGGG